MHVLELENVVKRFGTICAVDGVSFAVEKGELLCLFGPSGCGKTTTLRLIAGLEMPDEGVVRINGKVASGEGSYIPPVDRRIGMVFQDLALWPHMRVEKHLEFVVRGRGLPRQARQKRVDDLLDLCQLTDRRRAYPHELSGGEKQRLAIARALSTDPAILLLDEPLSGLDTELRTRMLAEIERLQGTLGVTVIYVTHHEHEALAIADRMVLLREGRVEGSRDIRPRNENPRISDREMESTVA